MRSVQSFAGMESLEDRKLFSAESYLSAVPGAAATDIISTKNGATFVVVDRVQGVGGEEGAGVVVVHAFTPRQSRRRIWPSRVSAP